jgi:hypothetical protein
MMEKWPFNNEWLQDPIELSESALFLSPRVSKEARNNERKYKYSFEKSTVFLKFTIDKNNLLFLD